MTSALVAQRTHHLVTRRPTEAVRAQAIRWLTLAAVVAAWQIACQTVLAGNDFLAAPSAVVAKGIPAVLSGDSLGELGLTTLRFLAAFAIVAIAGVPLGLALGRLRTHVFLGTRDVVSVLYALPLAPFYPLFVLWLGLGDKSEIAFGAIHGIVPVLLITMAAGAGVDANLIASSRAMGAGRVQQLVSVVLPATLPETISALKIGAALSLLGVLLGELLISVDGVGTFITQQVTNHQAARLDAMVLIICIGAIVVNAVLTSIERRASYWRPQD